MTVRKAKGALMIAIFIILLTGCGPLQSQSIVEFIDQNYQFKDHVTSSVNERDSAIIYIANDKTIEQVSSEIQQAVPPEKVSPIKNKKQTFVYPKHFVTLMVDENNENNILIEVASFEFVRDNYSPSFFDGMFAMWFLDEVLDVDDWGNKQKRRCQEYEGNCYGGYVASGGTYKGPRTIPPSFRGSPSYNRGGGPLAGK